VIPPGPLLAAFDRGAFHQRESWIAAGKLPRLFIFRLSSLFPPLPALEELVVGWAATPSPHALVVEGHMHALILELGQARFPALSDSWLLAEGRGESVKRERIRRLPLAGTGRCSRSDRCARRAIQEGEFEISRRPRHESSTCRDSHPNNTCISFRNCNHDGVGKPSTPLESAARSNERGDFDDDGGSKEPASAVPPPHLSFPSPPE
jgi:hypothetical protein